MLETEVRCTCTDWTVNAACAVHGVGITETMQAIRERESRRPEMAGLRLNDDGKLPANPCDLAGFIKMYWPAAIEPWQMQILERWDEARYAKVAGSLADPPLIVRATPEQQEALREAVRNSKPGPMIFMGVDPARGPDQSVRCVSRRLPNGMVIIDEITPVLSDEVWGAVRQVSAAEAQAEYNRRQTRLVEMAIAAGNSREAVASAVIGTFRAPPAQSTPPLGRMATQRLDPAAPVAACTAHITATSAMPELTCGACGWQGSASELRQDPGSTSPDEVVCPSCGCDATRDGSVYPTEPADMIGRATTTASSSPLDQAIRGSASLDPMGAQKPAEQLIPLTEAQKDDERRRVRARLEEMGRPL